MLCLRILHRCERSRFSKSARSGAPGAVGLLKDERGAALLEFAIALPLLVVFVVGIYDFSGAFNQKQKIEQAAQEGAIVAGAQPMSDIQLSNGNPASLQAVVMAVFNSLAGSGVLPNAGLSCTGPLPPIPAPPVGPKLEWAYSISGCSSAHAGDPLVITINRGWVSGTTPVAVGTMVTVTYPYHWQFNRVIQLLVSGASYRAQTTLTESATVHNQL